jgi:hypothetical protein
MQSTVRLGSLWTLVSWIAFAAVSPVWGQNETGYVEVSPKWNEKDKAKAGELFARQKLVRDILNNRTPLDASTRADFEDYFRNQVFKEMTLTSELGKLTERRQRFFRESFYRVNDQPPAVHEALVQLTYQMMQVLVNGYQGKHFHPAVRCNAMLIMGELNQQEASGIGSSFRPPVPYAPALDFILKQLDDPNQIDEVRMAGLLGILRHAEIYTASAQLNSAGGAETQQPQRNQRIIAAALRVAEEKDPPQGRTPEGHAWMRRRALDILIALRAPGNSVADLVHSILADPNAPVSLRLTAAEAIAKLNIKAPNTDPAATAETVAALAAEVCKSELAWWDAEKKREDEQKLLRSASGVIGDGAYPGGDAGYAMSGTESMMMSSPYGDSGYPSYGMAPGMKVEPKKKKVDPRIDRTQRRLKNTLFYVKLALDGDPSFAKPRQTRPNEPPAAPTEGGLLAQGDAKQKPQITTLSAAVAEMFTTVDTAEPEREKMLTALAANLQKLEGLTGVAASATGSGAPPGTGAPPSATGPGPSSAVPGPSSRAPAAKAAAPAPPAAAPGPAPNGAAPAPAPNGAAPAAPNGAAPAPAPNNGAAPPGA